MELLILCLSAFVLILFPEGSAEGALEGIHLCGTALIPSLLPFLMVTRLICARMPEPNPPRRQGRWDPTVLMTYFLSFIGGYPAGVATTVSFYKQGKLTKEDAQALIPYCNNSGPGFFIGVLGYGLFRDPAKGLLLYGIHVASSMLLFFLGYGKRKHLTSIRRLAPCKKQTFPQDFQDALGESCNTMLRICVLVILFSVTRKLSELILPHSFLRYMGLLELSSGILNTTSEDFILWAFLMGWGGLCVHLQSMSIWQEAGLKVKGYFAQKLLHGILSGLCAEILISAAPLPWIVILIFCCGFFFFLQKWGRNNEKNRL